MTHSVREIMAVCIVLFALTLWFALAHTPLANALDSAARERGGKAFQTSGCLLCHSITGLGGDRAPDLGAVGARLTAAQIKTQILNGGKGMPPFGGVLSNDVVNDLAAFLKTCKSLKAPGCRTWEATAPPQ